MCGNDPRHPDSETSIGVVQGALDTQQEEAATLTWHLLTFVWEKFHPKE